MMKRSCLSIVTLCACAHINAANLTAPNKIWCAGEAVRQCWDNLTQTCIDEYVRACKEPGISKSLTKASGVVSVAGAVGAVCLAIRAAVKFDIPSRPELVIGRCWLMKLFENPWFLLAASTAPVAVASLCGVYASEQVGVIAGLFPNVCTSVLGFARFFKDVIDLACWGARRCRRPWALKSLVKRYEKIATCVRKELEREGVDRKSLATKGITDAALSSALEYVAENAELERWATSEGGLAAGFLDIRTLFDAIPWSCGDEQSDRDLSLESNYQSDTLREEENSNEGNEEV